MAEPGESGAGYRVDPGALQKAGGVAFELRQTALTEAGKSCEATGAAVTGLTGWQTADQLRATQQLWEKQNDMLAERLGRTGGNLETSGQSYRAVEDANRSALGGGH